MSILDEIAEIIGSDAAIKLGQTMGGARIYFPITAKENHPLTIILGQEDAQKLCDYYAGDTLDIPSKRIFRELRDKIIRSDYHSLKLEQGSRANHLALKYGLSRRQVLNITRQAA
ncbi:hypothetical protein KIH87_16180 [Paraneptunicella aestuarii]|uniref:Mor transcription activator family protein n=1 Tax=Paraneptunicella aestuarii TaxID=2831148 RepID=UPI001E454F06|nr:Mor transcription activator family protein [Paraneptunicella aestuarii]UAA38210.1 hypothetical protein KIH87_16180 [Paraneptunicella aestuarii]